MPKYTDKDFFQLKSVVDQLLMDISGLKSLLASVESDTTEKKFQDISLLNPVIINPTINSGYTKLDSSGDFTIGNYDGGTGAFWNQSEATFNIKGTLTAASGTIGGWTIDATSIYTGTEDHSGYTTNAGDLTIYSDGSDASIHAKNFYIDTSGNLTCAGATIGTPTITGIQAGSEIAIQGWQHDMAFSATDHDTLAWGSGTITLLDGTTYSIDAGNTGTMSAITYIYLDIATSTTVLQITTTASTAVGTGKILIAVVQNVAEGQDVIFQVFGGKALGGLGKLITTADITNSAVASAKIAGLAVRVTHIADNAIEEAKVAADAITAAKIAVSGLDGTSGDVAANHIVAGMIQSNAVTSVKINADAVTAAKINVVGLDGATGRIVVADQTDADEVTAGINTHAVTLVEAGKIVISGATNLDDWRKTGDLTMIDGGSISTGTVTATQIAAGTITATEIFANTITANEIAANTITASEMNIATLSAISADIGTITAGTISTNVLIVGTNVVTAESRFNTFFKRYCFIGHYNDGLTEAAGGGTISRFLVLTRLDSGGNDCTLSSIRGHVLSGNSRFTPDNADFECICMVQLEAAADQDVYWGIGDDGDVTLPNNSVLITAHSGFVVEDGTLYASNGDGDSQATTEITGITLTDMNTYRIKYDLSEGEVYFYVNDVLKATHSTDLMGNGHDPSFLFGIKAIAGTKHMDVTNNYMLIHQ